MTSPESQTTQSGEQKANDKELNFRRQEQMFQRLLAEKESKMAELQQQLEQKRAVSEPDEDGSDEPYVDHKRLNKTLSSFEKKMEATIEKKAEEKARALLRNAEQDNWLRQNNDFQEVMQHAEKFATSNPFLAETILKMPDSFERQQLVYNNIKALGLHKAPEKGPTIQETIDAKRRSPYYQPSGIATAPFQGGGDFTPSGQKNAYEKMQQLKKQLRI